MLQLVVDQLQIHQSLNRTIYLLLFQQIHCFCCALEPFSRLMMETTMHYLHSYMSPIFVIILVIIPVLSLWRKAWTLCIPGLLKSLEMFQDNIFLSSFYFAYCVAFDDLEFVGLFTKHFVVLLLHGYWLGLVETALDVLLDSLLEFRHSVGITKQCLAHEVLDERICTFLHKQLAHFVMPICCCFEEESLSCDSIRSIDELRGDSTVLDQLKLIVAHCLEERALSKPIFVI